ncbi:hypothetical protein JAAARDRAFT_595724 [Jaapia argillacea MUCL 33604]|uniref:Uncharacterized protein n=1 Tax=Jaapia argillacea MUCL 33604 TaxID=933084 RepID=A0A067PZG8_9AGAM|nr:hypothetical protein JAAARDRAFT_595724 [Jaapia argillacea MUCL 33604]
MYLSRFAAFSNRTTLFSRLSNAITSSGRSAFDIGHLGAYSTLPSIQDGLNRKSTSSPFCFKLRTLDPNKLTPADFVDISSRKNFSVKGPVLPDGKASQSPVLFFRMGMRSRCQPFPPNTRGFFYFYHDPDAPKLLSSIRFRLTESKDPASFSAGRDLRYSNQVPWHIYLAALALHPGYAVYKSLLLKDSLVPPDLLSASPDAPRTRFRQQGVALHSLYQEFPVEFLPHLVIPLMTPDGVIDPLQVNNIFSDPRPHMQSHSYLGKGFARFELSTLPQHKNRPRTVVMRIVKILEGPIPAVDGYDGYTPTPQEGSLVLRRKSNGQLGPWSMKLDITRVSSHARLVPLVDAYLIKGLPHPQNAVSERVEDHVPLSVDLGIAPPPSPAHLGPLVDTYLVKGPPRPRSTASKPMEDASPKRASLRTEMKEEKTPKISRQSPLRWLPQTLDPKKLTSSDFIRIPSTYRVPVRSPGRSTGKFIISQIRMLGSGHKSEIDQGFPSNLQGFFYYDHDELAPQLLSTIKFRITDSDDPSGFTVGRDLCFSNGVPWHMYIATIAAHRSYTLFKDLLIKDGFVSSDVFSDFLTTHHHRVLPQFAPSEIVLHSLYQEFPIKFSPDLCIRIMVPDGMFQQLLLFGVWWDVRSRKDRRPMKVYTGNGFAQFEISSLPEHSHTNGRTLVLRITKIIDGPTPVVPGYDGYVSPPKEGSLLLKRQKGTKKLVPWSVDVDVTNSLQLAKLRPLVDAHHAKG